MHEKEAFNIIEWLKTEITKEGNEIIDLSYSIDVGHINQMHPLKPWVQEEFYDGVMKISINIEYKDSDLVKKERKRLMKFMHNENPEEL